MIVNLYKNTWKFLIKTQCSKLHGQSQKYNTTVCYVYAYCNRMLPKLGKNTFIENILHCQDNL